RERVDALDNIALDANDAIVQNVTRLKLLQIIYTKNGARAQIKTDIKTADLISPDQTILDLFKHIKNANVVKAKEMYLKLIDSYGVLSPDQNWIISKVTQKPI